MPDKKIRRKPRNPDYAGELVALFQSDLPKDELLKKLSGYHEKDIADALKRLSEDERKKLYPVLGAQKVSNVFSYIDDVEQYLNELEIEEAAKIVSHMDSDDAADVLDAADDYIQDKLVGLMDEDAGKDVRMILSYDSDEFGSRMTTNFIRIRRDMTVREAMHELVLQAGEHDNIYAIYAVDKDGRYCGELELKALITAREHDSLETLISTAYPYVFATEKVSDCLEKLRSYAEESIPVLDGEKHLLGVLTAQDIAEAVGDELGDDYAKLGGLTEEADLKERVPEAVKKRLPWLIILLFLGMGVSSVVGVFEAVVAALPVVICFQSLVLDMAGNVGTQSLAVTIRVLMDKGLTGKDKAALVWKELKIGAANGLILGVLAFVFLGLYIYIAKHMPFGEAYVISGCVGFSLLAAMMVSSLVGTLVPMAFHKLNIDPAVASGPLITTLNDLVAVVTYYGLVWLLLLDVLKMA